MGQNTLAQSSQFKAQSEDHVQLCIDLLSSEPDLNQFKNDNEAIKIIQDCYGSKEYGGSFFTVSQNQLKNKSDELYQEIVKIGMKIQKKEDGGDFVDINNCGMYTMNQLQVYDSEDPQSLESQLYVDVEILVENLYEIQVQRRYTFGFEEQKQSSSTLLVNNAGRNFENDEKMISGSYTEMPSIEDVEQEALKFKDVQKYINGYGRLTYYRVYNNKTEPNNMTITIIQEGKFEGGQMNGFCREFDATTSGGIRVGHFNNDLPSKGRCKRYSLDGVLQNDSVLKVGFPEIYSSTSKLLNDSQTHESEKSQESIANEQIIKRDRTFEFSYTKAADFSKHIGQQEGAQFFDTSQQRQIGVNDVAFNAEEALNTSRLRNDEDQEDEDDLEVPETSRQLIQKSNEQPQVDETIFARVENPDLDKEFKPIDLDTIKVEEQKYMEAEAPQIRKAKSIRKKKVKVHVPQKSYQEAKQFWEQKVRAIARKTEDIKKSLVLKPSKDDSDVISLVSENDESMDFQPCYSYHSMTDDETAYVSARNDKIFTWPKNRRNKHVLKLWKSAFLRASIVGTLVSKTYQNKIDKKFRAQHKLQDCCDEDAVIYGGNVQRPTQTSLEHQKLFGVIPTQRQLGKRFLKKLERKALMRGQNGEPGTLIPKDIKDKITVEEFLNDGHFHSDNQYINMVVPEKNYWDKETTGNTPDPSIIDEYHILNHKYYDRMDFLISNQKYQLSKRVEKAPPSDKDNGQNVACSTIFNKNDDEESSEDDDIETEKFEDLIPDRYTITQNGTFYSYWRPIMVLANLVTNILYPIYTIQTFDEMFTGVGHGMVPSTHEADNIWFYIHHLKEIIMSLNAMEAVLIFCEIFFFINIIINFFLQANDDAKIPMKQSRETITWRYLQGRFFMDLIVLLPMGLIMSFAVDSKLRFFWMIKGLRVIDLNYYISDKFWAPFIRNAFTKFRINQVKYISSEEMIVDDKLYIEKEIYALNIQKISRMAMQMIIACYFFGNYFWVCSSTVRLYFLEILQNDDIDTWVYYEGNWDNIIIPLGEKLLVNVYFGVTTLSTVGFGDFYPVADSERLVGAFLLYFGQAGFNFLCIQFLDVLESIQRLDQEDTSSDQLQMFFSCLKSFNNSQPIDKDIQNSWIDFFKYKSINGKNNFLNEDQDQAIFDKLTLEMRQEIYTKFVYRRFLTQFKMFFQIHKSARNPTFSEKNKNCYDTIELDSYEIRKGQKTKNQIKQCGLEYPFYTFENKDYADFVTCIFNILEVRTIARNTVIQEEISECNEIIFVEKGQYMMGFQVNKKDYYKRQFKEGSIINAFNVLYDVRSQYLVKSNKHMHCYWIRKTDLKQLVNQFPTFEIGFKQNSIKDYNMNIHQPLQRYKKIVQSTMHLRRDLEQIIDTKDCMKENIVVTCLLNDQQEVAERLEELENQSECQRILGEIDVSFEHIIFYAFKMTQKTEYLQAKFWEELFQNCLRQKYHSENLDSLLNKTRRIILPTSLIHQKAVQKKYTSMEAYNEDYMIRQLGRDMFPDSPYFKIRQELIRNGRFRRPQNVNEARLLKLYTKNHRYRKLLSIKQSVMDIEASLKVSKPQLKKQMTYDSDEIHDDPKVNGLRYSSKCWNEDFLEESVYELPRNINDANFFELIYKNDVNNMKFLPNLDFNINLAEDDFLDSFSQSLSDSGFRSSSNSC